MIIAIIFIILMLLLRIIFWKNKYEEIEKKIEKLKQREFLILIEKPDVNQSLEKRFRYISASNIIIHNVDEYFYNSLEEKRNIYEKIVRDSQKFKEMLDDGMTIQDIMNVEEYANSAYNCFDLTVAIMGEEINGIIYLTNGRHRCMIAKELRVDVPIYIKGRYISKKIEDMI